MSEINLYQGQDIFRVITSAGTFIIREPVGWDAFMAVRPREVDKIGFFKIRTNLDLDLEFDEVSGKPYLDAEFDLHGPDGNAVLQFGKWDGVTFTEKISGRVSFDEYTKSDKRSRSGISALSDREKIRTRNEIKCDVNGTKDLDNNTITPLSDTTFMFHSKVLRKMSKLSKSETESVFPPFKTSNIFLLRSGFTTIVTSEKYYGNLGLDFIEPAELQDLQTNVLGIIQRNFPLVKVLWYYKARERGQHEFDISLDVNTTFSYEVDAFKIDPLESASYSKSDCLIRIELVLSIKGVETIVYSLETDDCEELELATGDITINEEYLQFLDQNDEVLLFFRYTNDLTFSSFFNSNGVQVIPTIELEVKQSSSFSITALTETRYSNAGGIMIHEAADKMLEIITGTKQMLKSNLIGRKDLGYEEDGPASKYALTNGKKIRNFDPAENHLQFTLNEFFNSMDAIFCCGMGMEKSDGKYFLTIDSSNPTFTSLFLFPDGFESSQISFYLKADNSLLGVVSEVTLVGGAGTTEDPYEYNVGSGTIDLIGTAEVYIIIENLVDKEIIRFEKREYFFRDILLFQIPTYAINKSSYLESPNVDLMYNHVSIGYKKYPENELNTLDEFNTKREYLTPLKTIKNKLEKLSDFIASGYALEFQRRRLFENEGNQNSSAAYDDDVFIIALTEEKFEVPIFEIKDDYILLTQKVNNLPEVGQQIEIAALPGNSTTNAGTYTIASIDTVGALPRRTKVTVTTTLVNEIVDGVVVKYLSGKYNPERSQPFETVENIISPETSYNLRISPKRMFLNWAKWINSGLFHKDSSSVIKQTFSKNNAVAGGLETQFLNTESNPMGDVDKALIIENSDLTLTDYQNFDRIFKPIKIEFKARLEFEELQYIFDRLEKGYLENAYGYIEFYDLDGNTRKGFIMDITYNPSIEEVKFTLIEKA